MALNRGSGGSGSGGSSTEVQSHLDDATAAHAASAIAFTPVGTIAANDVQSAVAEVATDAATALTAAVAAAVSDTAYAGSWNGVATIAPSKNAVYDQMELKAPLASPTFTGVPAMPTAAVNTNTTQGATTAFVQTQIAASVSGRNKIINGGMSIDQRNAGAAVTAIAGGIFGVDRWSFFEDTDGGFTAQRSTTTPPAGFTHFTRVTVTSADASLSAAQFAVVQYKVEGNDIADLDWGLSTAQAITISFRVRSSLTGTFGGSVRNSAGNRSYPFTYAISSANTWESKTVTISGDTTGTWLTDTGIGIMLTFGLGVGSTNSGTAGAWAASNLYSATSAVSVIGTNAATWDITGVQLEVGSVATPFERRSVAAELEMCQRYYEKSYDLATVPGTVTTSGEWRGYDVIVSGQHTFRYSVRKRSATPTLAYYSPATGTVARYHDYSSAADFVPSDGPKGETSFVVSFATHGAADELIALHWTSNAEL